MKNDTQVLKISNEIRELLHRSTIAKTKVFLKREKGFWDQLWVCLDTINHTEKGILEFKRVKDEDFSKSPNILTYGLLQNLFVQQDALSNLSESLLGKKVQVWSTKQPALFYVRDIRNITIGHPTKKDKNETYSKHCVIDQSRLTRDGFSYWVWSRSGFEEKYIKFSDLLSKQRTALLAELKKIHKQIKKKEVLHKKKFKDQSLSELLPQGEPYSFSVLRKLAYDQLGWIMFVDLRKKYEEIRQGIEDRYGKLNQTLRVPGTKVLIEELDRIFQRIDELKNAGPDVEIELNIFADALVERLKELKTHLDEIDEEFKT